MEKILENIAKGYDVMRGQTVIKHFNTKEGAEKFINGRHGYYVRYWILSDKEEQTARRLFFIQKLGFANRSTRAQWSTIIEQSEKFSEKTF